MSARTNYITSMVTDTEYAVLEQMKAEQPKKSMSSIVRELLLSNSEFAGRLSLFLSGMDSKQSISRGSKSIAGNFNTLGDR